MRCDGSRAERADATDAWVGSLFAAGQPAADGLCLVAVGGYGRRELAPGSDLDLVLLHRGDGAAASEIADGIWYPIWDAGIALDHSVRSLAQARRMAADDVRVLLGLLDARAVAGDERLADELRAAVYADWRAMAARRLPQLRALVTDRREQHGDLCTMLEPHLKEAYGGLREASVLRAIAASWVSDIPHAGWVESHAHLMDIRDALHRVTGRSSDVLRLQEQQAVAELLGLGDADTLLRSAYQAARTIAHASDTAWHRVDRSIRRPGRWPSARRRASVREPLAEGVVMQDGEVMLSAHAHPERDPVLVLRAAAAAAQSGLPLAAYAVQRLARDSAAMPVPWPPPALDAFICLLGSGPALVGTWEALDQAGIIDALIPGWAVIRSAPQRNAIHRFTVDRHLVQTAVQACGLTRTVHRPDLLLIAALLHDFGKARGDDHSVRGAHLAAELAVRMGFDARDVEVIATLVRHHLLLAETATQRDLDDPATIAAVAACVGDADVLDLLAALTQADGLATGPGLWSRWRQSLIGELVQRTHAALAGRPRPQPPAVTDELRAGLGDQGVHVLLDRIEVGYQVCVGAPDQHGLLALVAGVLAVHRLQVRSATVSTTAGRATQVWNVEPIFGDPPAAEQLADDLRRAMDGRLDVDARLRSRDLAYRRIGARPNPRVDIIAGAQQRAAILEVRAHDEPGLLYRIATAIAAANVMITGARVATLGSQAVDVFFLADERGQMLAAPQADRLSVAVLQALAQPIP